MKIGLEVHVQLATRTKLFCGCPVREGEPNTLTCPTCLGLPGSRPRVNAKAVEHAVKIALALNCRVPERLVFSRKTYFYPDMAKNYQITQFEVPVGSGGWLEVGGRKIGIRRVNLEEDPARLVHVGGFANQKYVLVDYNRSGIPLCEIVTEPELGSPEEARLFLQTLASLLDYLDVWNGTIKTDANISTVGARVEIKNISGFREVEKALRYEALRQKRVGARRETRAWDPEAGVTRSLRKKETEEDYGYIFEPDIPPVRLGPVVRSVRPTIPELPWEKRERFEREFGLGRELSKAVTSDADIAILFEKTAEKFDPKFAASWITVVKKVLNYNKLRLKDTGFGDREFAEILRAVSAGELSDRAAELVLREVVPDPGSLNRAIEKYGKVAGGSVEAIVEDVVKENPEAVADYLKGNEKALHFLVGRVMAKTGGRADAREVREMLKKKLSR